MVESKEVTHFEWWCLSPPWRPSVMLPFRSSRKALSGMTEPSVCCKTSSEKCYSCSVYHCRVMGLGCLFSGHHQLRAQTSPSSLTSKSCLVWTPRVCSVQCTNTPHKVGSDPCHQSNAISTQPLYIRISIGNATYCYDGWFAECQGQYVWSTEHKMLVEHHDSSVML